MVDHERNLEFDLQALASRMRADRAFATDVYFALCNTDWRHADGTEWFASMRHVAGLVAALRGRSEDYMDFYCSPGAREGVIAEQVAEAMADLGWTGVPQSKQIYKLDPASSEKQAYVDGSWEDAINVAAGGIREFMKNVEADPALRADLELLGTPQTDPLDDEEWWPAP